MAIDDVQAVEAADGVQEDTNGKAGSEAPAASTGCGSEVKTGEPASTTADAAKASGVAWKRWSERLWGGGAAAVIMGTLGALVAGWVLFLASPPAKAPSPDPTAKQSTYQGHLPGRQDVSTMAPGHRFYAVPNFYEFQSCGRPCWLPLYQSPTEHSPFVTDGWPCEYYGPNSSSPPSCVRPPARRTTGEMAKPKVRNSGDRVLVVCQVSSKTTQTIKNEIDQSSNIWDMVAVPGSYISPDSTAVQLSQIPRMPGLYEAFAPDIWLGNTGWHGIPCTR